MNGLARREAVRQFERSARRTLMALDELYDLGGDDWWDKSLELLVAVADARGQCITEDDGAGTDTRLTIHHSLCGGERCHASEPVTDHVHVVAGGGHG